MAAKQLGGVRTGKKKKPIEKKFTKLVVAATEAAQMVKKNQVDMDRSRGIASVHGNRAKEDQMLIQQSWKKSFQNHCLNTIVAEQKEADEFARRQQAMLQRTEQNIAQAKQVKKQN